MLDFEGFTYREITLELLLNGFLTVTQCIRMRIEFENIILKPINNN
ncbi:MAG TPA: hypothetical protein VIK14_16340 [Ignavibacteria bacterium]